MSLTAKVLMFAAAAVLRQIASAAGSGGSGTAGTETLAAGAAVKPDEARARAASTTEFDR